MSDDDLTNHFLSLFPTQMPSNFQISPSPAEITSFVWETLSELKKRKQSLETHTSSELHPGKCGKNSCFDVDGTGVSFWMNVRESKSMTYSAASPKPDECLVRTASRSPVDTFKILLETYHRASVSLEEPTQDLTTKDWPTSPYPTSIDPTRTKTHHHSTRKQSPLASCLFSAAPFQAPLIKRQCRCLSLPFSSA